MENYSPYTFKMVSDPPALEFSEELPLRVYPRILLRDSLFEFFPYSEVHYKDSTGQISDKIFFIEGLKFDVTLEKEEEKDKDGNVVSGGIMSASYVWSENQINFVEVTDKISGNNVFIMLSSYDLQNIPKSRAFNYENAPQQKVNEIVEQIVTGDWNIPKEKLFISPTLDGFPYVNQCGINNRAFIEQLAEIAYSPSYKLSPVYTFINCRGEFYFQTLEEMMAELPVREYQIKLSEDMQTNPNIIKSYNVQCGGMAVNKDNYKRKFYRFTSDSILHIEDLTIHEATPKFNDKDKLLIRNEYIPKEEHTSHSYFGLQTEENGLEEYLGYKNNFYRDTALCYRMIIVVLTEPDLVTGKTVTITVNDNEDETAQEYQGKWLICDSTHTMNEQGIPYSQLIISKPKIQLDSDHPIKDFG